MLTLLLCLLIPIVHVVAVEIVTTELLLPYSSRQRTVNL